MLGFTHKLANRDILNSGTPCSDVSTSGTGGTSNPCMTFMDGTHPQNTGSASSHGDADSVESTNCRDYKECQNSGFGQAQGNVTNAVPIGGGTEPPGEFSGRRRDSGSQKRRRKPQLAVRGPVFLVFTALQARLFRSHKSPAGGILEGFWDVSLRWYSNMRTYTGQKPTT